MRWLPPIFYNWPRCQKSQSSQLKCRRNIAECSHYSFKRDLIHAFRKRGSRYNKPTAYSALLLMRNALQPVREEWSTTAAVLLR